MKTQTDQPTDLYVAVDMPCIGCGYNLRTLAVATACPECSRPIEDTWGMWRLRIDVYVHRTLCEARVALTWIPLAAISCTILLCGFAWVQQSVVLLGPMLCWTFILGVVYFAASCEFVVYSSSLTGVGSPYVSLFIVLLLSGGLGCVSYLRGSAETAALSAGLLATLLMACTSWYAHTAAFRFGDQDLGEYARLCFRIALAASAVQMIAEWVHWAVWYTPGIGFANRIVRNYAAVTLLVVVGATVVAHSILMFRMKTWLSRFA